MLHLNCKIVTKIITLSNKQGVPVVLDCSGETLKESLNNSEKPCLIKPNLEELSALLHKNVVNEDDTLKKTLTDPLFDDIEWIVVSLGGDGAFVRHGNDFYRVQIPKIKVVNAVGSGDATVAGLCSAIAHEESDDVLLKRANTLGMLNAQEKMTGHINCDRYDELFSKISVSPIA
ncbi:MAG TPA: hypothetical protein DIW15_00030 [Bavariicoccus seileri]|uniref:Carbohydrate kinase PfkB domain-containing protein n=1 Tax=Bavariicoccus seileri TaxID=549685 RepID=A0A3D4S2M8_9ENTE|nr:hypothetical protein [Bavariicoccus seileri]